MSETQTILDEILAAMWADLPTADDPAELLAAIARVEDQRC